MDDNLKQFGWSIVYYKTFNLIGKYKIDNSDIINVGYPEICVLNIVIQLNNIEENTFCTMKNSNLSKIMCCKERQLQLYLSHLKSIGVIYMFEDRLPNKKNVTTKRTIYVDYKKISELTSDTNKIRVSCAHKTNKFKDNIQEINAELELYLLDIFSKNKADIAFENLKILSNEDNAVVNKVANNILYKDFLETNYWKCVSREKKRRVSKCQICGSDKNIQVHHNSYVHHGYEHEFIDEDLTCLCKDCHKKFHS